MFSHQIFETTSTETCCCSSTTISASSKPAWEVSGLMGQMSARLGYQPTMGPEVSPLLAFAKSWNYLMLVVALTGGLP
jgi:hypothetical protein